MTQGIGIVGSEASKFTFQTRGVAMNVIRGIILMNPGLPIVSGGCHLGGIDIYAEDMAAAEGRVMVVHTPKKLQWSGGYRERNIKIARDSREVHVITVRELPEGYTGRRFKHCYHCQFLSTPPHVKSGGCWTAKYALKMGSHAYWHIIDGDSVVHHHVAPSP